MNFWNNFQIKDLHFTQKIVEENAHVKAEVEVLSVYDDLNVNAKIYVR